MLSKKIKIDRRIKNEFFIGSSGPHSLQLVSELLWLIHNSPCCPDHENGKTIECSKLFLWLCFAEIEKIAIMVMF